LPVSKWYIDETSQWTLDYPPFFAWFEYCLAQVAFYFDWKMLIVENLEYASQKTIVFQRLSVIFADLLLLYSAFSYCKFQCVPHGKSTVKSIDKYFIICSIAFNAGLLMVDHIHFQYNGFLFGLLILSLGAMNEHKYLKSAFWFMVLLNFKHIFLYIAPVYIIYLLRNYCFQQSKAPLKGVSRIVGVNIFNISTWNLLKLAFIVVSIFAISLGPFIYMGQLLQLVSRLFPVKRGLCHAYWAANFWAFYNIGDKSAYIAARKLGIIFNSTETASMTGGLVAQQRFQVLPNISPLITAVVTIVTMMPVLLKIWYKSAVRNLFLPGLILCAYSSFLFGYHVHEKAIIIVVLPLTLLVPNDVTYARVYVIVQTVGHYALFPLLYKSAETPIKLSIFMLFTIISICWMKELPRLKVHTSSSFGLPFVRWYEALYLYGLIPLYIFTDILHPYMAIATNFPFLPLLMTSLYCAMGVHWSWLLLLRHFIKMK